MSLNDELNKPKKQFVKSMQQNEMTFQLLDMEATPEFKIWDEPSHQWFREGQGMKIIDIEGNPHTIEYINEKNIDEETWCEYFPNHKTARTHTIKRNIRVWENNQVVQEGSYDMKVSANKELLKQITTINNIGGNPLKALFLMKKPSIDPVTKKKGKTYTVEAIGQAPEVIEQPKPAINTPNLTLKPVGGIQITLPNKAPLNEQEKALAAGWKAYIANPITPSNCKTLEYFKMMYTQSKEALGVISDERLSQIYNEM